MAPRSKNGQGKVQLAGPWTLAATIEQLRSLKPALADRPRVAEALALVGFVNSSTRRRQNFYCL